MKPTARTYFLAWLAMMSGFVISVGLAFVNLGVVNIIIALGVTLCQMGLTLLVFMRVRYSSHLIWLFAASGFYWLGVLFVLGLNDYLSRGWLF